MRPPLVLNGSARRDGDTARAVAAFVPAFPGTVTAMLCQTRIAPYVYAPARLDDDFVPLVDAMLATDDIVFATPVYWYAMGWPMKVFFDRLTDLLRDAGLREKGRALAGRRGWLIAVGTDPELPPGFEEPFRRTCRYFGMNWETSLYLNSRGGNWDRHLVDPLGSFTTRLRQARGGV